MVTVEEIFKQYPDIHVKSDYEKLVLNGNTFYHNQTTEESKVIRKEPIKVYCNNRFYGIYQFNEEDRKYKPIKMFLQWR